MQKSNEGFAKGLAATFSHILTRDKRLLIDKREIANIERKKDYLRKGEYRVKSSIIITFVYTNEWGIALQIQAGKGERIF